MLKGFSDSAFKGYAKVCGNMKKKETPKEKMKRKAEQNTSCICTVGCLFIERFFSPNK